MSLLTKQSTKQQTKWHAKNSLFVICACALLTVFFSCSTDNKNQLIIWTDDAQIVSYVEFYNSLYEDAQAVVVYKVEPANSLPPAKDEIEPDIVIGPWLKNSNTRKYFKPLDYLFEEGSISRSSFYSQVIDYGKMNDRQYLIPISFNLPAIIYSRRNENLIQSDHLLNLEQIKEISLSFNKQNKNGAFTAMGYAPSWDSEFLYFVTKLYGASYREKGNSFLWNKDAMQNAVSFIKNWTIENNTDTTTEQNFQFRYLYMPKYRQVASERCLFAYMPSNEFFTLADTQTENLTFRWIEKDQKIPIEDNLISLGIYKNSSNVKKAEKFIAWLVKEETQKSLIERTQNMKLDTSNFGIAGGFSSVKNVNEKVYPAYYRKLLGNLPAENFITMPYILPYQWPNIKDRVIIPYLTESTSTAVENPRSLEERILDWTKQTF